MKQPNNIRFAVDQISIIAHKYQASISARIQNLSDKIKKSNEINLHLKTTITESAKGPSWARLPLAKDMWKIGSGKIWNRRLPQLKKKYLQNAKEMKHLKGVLATEKKVLQRIQEMLKRLQTLGANKASYEELPQVLTHQMHAVVSDLKRFPITTEHGISHAITAIQSIADEARQQRPMVMPPVIRKDKSGDQNLLPYKPSYHEPIYLPIPKNLGFHAKAIGAQYDPNIAKAGRYFVPANTDLKPFDRYLPLAFRQEPPKLRFYPQEPDTVKKVNLRTIFDDVTWDYIRTTNYAKTDNRCVICGKRSGDLLDRMAPESTYNRADRVECHEVWEWYRPKKDISIGVQQLKGLYIVCFKCHMSFHDGIARSMLRAEEDQLQFARDLHAHRSHITRVDQATLYNEMVDLNKRTKTMNKIDYWIVDLSHLTNQDYMRHIAPVFLEHNRAGIGVEQIAGFEFTTDTGEKLPARGVKEIFYEIAPRYPAISVESLLAKHRM